MVGILGPDGLPVSSATLNQEIAIPTDIGVRAVHREGVASGLSPESLAALLQDASAGQARRYLTLAEEMEERYLHYASQLQTRRLAVEAIAPSVEVPEGVPGKIADAVHDLIEAPAFRDMIGNLMDAVAKGYSAVEMLWDYTGGVLKPVRYIWRDPRFFQFERVGLTELRLAADGNFDGVPVPDHKFICHVPRSKMGIPLRRGMARPAAWAFMLQSFSLKDWAGFSEVYGMPIRLGRYPAAASKNDVRTLLNAVRSIASDAAAVVPVGMDIEFTKVEGSHGTAVFGGLIDYVDKQISKLVVGQTMTSDDGGSLAQAYVHNEVRLDICRADGRQLGNTITRDVVMPFVAFNFGPQQVYPRVGFPVAEPEDIKALSSALGIVVPLGLKVGQKEIRAKLGLSEPEDGEELLAQPAPAPVVPPPDPEGTPPAALHVRGCRCGGCLTGLSADPGDFASDGLQLTDGAMGTALDGWTEITDPLLGPLLSAARGAETFDAALAAIRKRGPDGAALLDRLATATAIARGIGDVVD